MPEYIADVSPFKKWLPIKTALAKNKAIQVSASSISATCDFVNKQVNTGFIYVRDGIADTWKSPAQFKKDGYGDCEDFSIYKMSLLIEKGVPKQMMEIVICFDKWSREYHCVLRVFEGAKEYILDNQSVKLHSKSSFKERYNAIYALSLSGWRLCP